MIAKCIFCCSVLALATPAIASGDGGSSPFAGDIGNALWTLVIFTSVIVVLGKFAWGPVLDLLKKREDFIHDSLRDAKTERQEAEALLAKYKEQLETARKEATSIVDEGRRDSEVLKRKIEEDARTEADKMIERAKREIGIATDTAVKELYELSGKMATEVAAKIIHCELDENKHRALITSSIDEMMRASKN